MNSSPMILRLRSGSARPRPAGRGTAPRPRRGPAGCRTARRPPHLLGLVQPHQAVVDEDAGQLLPHRPVDEQRRDRGVDAAGEAADHPPLADLGADRLDLLGDHRLRRPLAARSRRSRAGSGSGPRSRRACGRPRGGTGCRRGRGRAPRRRRPARSGSRPARRSPAAARRRCRGGSSSSSAPPAARRAASRRRCAGSARPARTRPTRPPSTLPPSAWTIACIP